MSDEIKDLILSAVEASLEAQLRAVRHTPLPSVKVGRRLTWLSTYSGRRAHRCTSR